MTLIESFDRSPLQNIAGCLALKPQTLILVGPSAEIEKSAAHYRALLQEKGQETQVLTLPLEPETADRAAVVFEELVKKYSPCIFDLFGGNELLIAAAGMVYQELKDRYEIELLQPELFGETDAPQLSVKQTIELNGGLILSEKSAAADGYTAAELSAVWGMMTKNPNRWNKRVGILNEFEKRADRTADRLGFSLDLAEVGIAAEKREVYLELLEKLYLRGVLADLKRQETKLQYRYKNLLLRRCLKTAGNLLEYKTLLEARDYAPHGAPFFNDSLLGVMLDWDGIIQWSSEADTKNEIDVLAMRGVVPLFISCKNGQVDEEELYKLHTVASALGGEFAKKMLIMTDYDQEQTASGRAFIQRAQDMGILLEPHAALLDQAGWHQLFERAFL